MRGLGIEQQSPDVILKRLWDEVPRLREGRVAAFPAPLVQRPSTSAFQAGDHGFESRTGYQLRSDCQASSMSDSSSIAGCFTAL